MMTAKDRLPKFRQYLAALRGRREAPRRPADAGSAFGNLGKLDASPKRRARSHR
jgi:hypothetical protein